MRRSFVLAATTMMLACWGWSSTAQAANTKITFLVTPAIGQAPAFVAKDQGFFEKRGLDVEITNIVNQPVIVGALTSGQVQVANITALDVILAANAGIDLAIFAVGATTYPNTEQALSSLVVLNDSSIKTAADLVGKRVAVPSLNTYFHLLARRWLKSSGVDPAGVRFVELGMPLMPDALRSGQIDAGLTAIPFVTRIVPSIGRAVVRLDDTLPPGTTTAVYVVKKSWASANREAVTAFREALNEGAAFIKANDAEGRASLARHTKQPIELLAAMKWPELNPALNAEQVQFFIDLAKQEGLAAQSPPPDQLIFR